MFRNNISAAYVLLVGLPLLLLLGVLQIGSGLPAPVSVAAGRGSPAGPAPAPLNLIKLVLQIGVILVAARIVGMLFRKIRQPQVVGEMVAGDSAGALASGVGGARAIQCSVPRGQPGLFERSQPGRAGALHVPHRCFSETPPSCGTTVTPRY